MKYVRVQPMVKKQRYNIYKVHLVLPKNILGSVLFLLWAPNFFAPICLSRKDLANFTIPEAATSLGNLWNTSG